MLPESVGFTCSAGRQEKAKHAAGAAEHCCAFHVARFPFVPIDQDLKHIQLYCHT